MTLPKWKPSVNSLVNYNTIFPQQCFKIKSKGAIQFFQKFLFLKNDYDCQYDLCVTSTRISRINGYFTVFSNPM